MLVDQGNDSESFGVDLSPDFSSCNCIMRFFHPWFGLDCQVGPVIDGLTMR